MSRVRRGAGAELTARIATVQPGRHLDGRSRARWRRGDGLPVQRSGDRGVHAAPARPRVPQSDGEWGSGFIVGGHNYGQGSSREHAAIAPLFLGVRGVFAKSFARIHRRTLTGQGILALTFVDDADFERAEVGQCWCLPHIRDELAEGSDRITVCIEDNGDEFALTHDFADKEREILLRGGLLEYLRAGAA
jgi:3-isopropylmalate dehydratase small subunit